MKKAKPEHRSEYWKYCVAAHSFEQARDVASGLLDMPNPETQYYPLYYPLMISLHVFYARPFKHPKELRRIEQTLVPDSFLTVHEMLIKMRDRIFAHHDKDSKITDSKTGVDLFQLTLEVANGEMRPGVQIVFPTGDQLSKVKNLCSYLYQTCTGKAYEALIKCIGVVPKDGIYRVSTNFEGMEPLLIQSEWSTEQSRGHLKETVRRMPDSDS